MTWWPAHLSIYNRDKPVPPADSAAPAPTDRMVLGAQAKRLLDDPVLQLALGAIDRKLVETWKSSAVGDDDGRHAAYCLHWAVDQLRRELQLMVSNASVLEAEAKMRDAEAAREQARRERWEA